MTYHYKPVRHYTTHATQFRHTIVRRRLLSSALIVTILGLMGLVVSQYFPLANSVVKSSTPVVVARPVTITIAQSKPFPALREDYMADSSVWRLVNKQNPLNDKNYQPDHLVEVPVAFRQNLEPDERVIRADTALQLKDMFAAAKEDNIHLMVNSAFRSATTQESYLNSYIATSGRDTAEQYTALPGRSEHQTGLAVDISTFSTSCHLTQCFINKPESTWLMQHAHEFGFVLRYPEGKEALTEYHAEAWHYRYLGKQLATALYDSNLVFEEVQPQLQATLAELKARNPTLGQHK